MISFAGAGVHDVINYSENASGFVLNVTIVNLAFNGKKVRRVEGK